MSIAVDAMGGDHAPEAIIRGVLEAAPQVKRKIILVGDLEKMKPFTQNLPSNIELLHASEAVEMNEKPLDSYRNKKDSSLRVCANLVKEEKADAMISAGNTGACVATCLLTWRQLQGMHRPAIASIMPNVVGQYLLLDSGASPDVDPEHLVEFALMGRAFAEKVMGKPNPTVQLLNIGEEEGKGNAFAKEAYALLKPFHWFKGNVEGKDMFNKPTDVVICDAFVGNIALKSSEGVADMVFAMIKNQVPKHPIRRMPYMILKKVLQPLRAKADWAEIGGSPLLGLNGICIIAHGRSDMRATKNAVLMADRCISGKVLETIKESIARELPAK